MSSALFTKPRFKHCFAVEVIGTRALFLITEHRQHVFEGEVYTLLAQYLNGQYSFAEIMTALGDRVTTQELFSALTHLSKRGCLVESSVVTPEHASFWDYLHNDPQEVSVRLDTSRVKIESRSTAVSQQLMIEVFAGAGLTIDERAPFLVIAVDDYLQEDLEAINARALAEGFSWTLLKPVGMEVWIGPVFRPGETGCWKCLEQRLLANRQVEGFIKSRSANPVRFRTSRASLSSTIMTGLSLAAVETAKSIVLGGSSRAGNELLTLDLCSMQLTKHAFVKRPQCPACGSPELQKTLATLPLHLQARPLSNSGWRTVSANETFERYKHHISPISGIVTSLIARDVEQFEDSIIHNYVAGHYFPILHNNLSLLRVNAFVRSGGKGATDIQAKTGALCESIERYSGIYWGDEPIIEASFNELKPLAYHIQDLALFSEAQYRNRDQWNAKQQIEREMVPEPLDDDVKIAWTQAWSLTHQCFKFVPMGYCYYGFRDPGKFICYSDSNGNAAGNTLEEAILHGLVELIERDSVALWWYNMLRRPAVDTASFQLPYWEEMQNYYNNSLQRDIHVLDLTSDLMIPTFAVISRRRNHSTEDIILGLGAHLDPKHALTRALEEANQYLPALCETTDDGRTLYRLNEKDIIDWWSNATFSNQPYLVPDSSLPMKTLADYSILQSRDLNEHISHCVELIGKAGMEVLVLNQTRPDIGLPVVKVMVPGLRHFWRRHAPGRLYDIPVKMGWLDSSNREDQLNPIACFV